MSVPSPNSPVEDHEFLYRSIRCTEIKFDSINNKLRVSANGFNDKKNQPSVDRAILRDNNPKKTQMSDTDYVVALHAKEVREERIKSSETIYALDVKADPEDKNESHAIIVPAPEYKTKSVFNNKVRERLARLAEKNIIIDPTKSK